MDACKELFGLPTEEKAEYMDAGLIDPVRVGTGFNSAVDGAKYWRDYGGVWFLATCVASHKSVAATKSMAKKLKAKL
jgi:hypothetical protein